MGNLVFLPKFVIRKSIKAERQRTFDVIANYENYQTTLPRYFPSVRVRSVRENVAIVEEHLKLGDKELVMTTKHVTIYPESHEIFVLGGDAKGTHIIESYEKSGDGTMLTVTADFKLNGKLRFASLFGNKIESDYGKIMDEFCSIAET
ncbi:MAG: SRPBCC family protein [Candidatus Nitrosotenuis sp.]|jgi:coenzyme Q-binding protein COQ10